MRPSFPDRSAASSTTRIGQPPGKVRGKCATRIHGKIAPSARRARTARSAQPPDFAAQNLRQPGPLASCVADSLRESGGSDSLRESATAQAAKPVGHLSRGVGYQPAATLAPQLPLDQLDDLAHPQPPLAQGQLAVVL